MDSLLKSMDELINTTTELTEVIEKINKKKREDTVKDIIQSTLKMDKDTTSDLFYAMLGVTLGAYQNNRKISPNTLFKAMNNQLEKTKASKSSRKEG